MVAYKDKLIAGRKARRHEGAGNDLDMAAYEHIVRHFGKPDDELWDTRNEHLLLAFKMNGNRSVKLAIQMTKNGAEIVSGFYIPSDSVEAAIKGGEWVVP